MNEGTLRHRPKVLSDSSQNHNATKLVTHANIRKFFTILTGVQKLL